MGLLGGFTSPMIVGSVTSLSGTTALEMLALGVVSTLGAIVTIQLPKADSSDQVPSFPVMNEHINRVLGGLGSPRLPPHFFSRHPPLAPLMTKGGAEG